MLERIYEWFIILCTLGVCVKFLIIGEYDAALGWFVALGYTSMYYSSNGAKQ